MTDKELQQKVKDQEIYIVGLQYKIQELEHKLEHFENYQREKCCECEREAIVKYAESEGELFDLKQKIGELIK